MSSASGSARRDGDPGVPVRPGPCPGAGAHAAARMPARPGSPGTGGWPGAGSATQAEGKWYSGSELHKLWNAREEGRPGAGLVGGELQVRLPGGVPGSGPGAAGLHQSRRRASGRESGWASRGSRSAAGAGTRSGSPPARSRCAGSTVTLPRLGTIGTHESTRKLARRLETGTARILSATVSRTAAAMVRVVHRRGGTGHPGAARPARLGHRGRPRRQDPADRRGRPGDVITVPGPKALRSSLRRLRRASRAHSRKARGSANRRKSAARLARIHARVANVRADALHKATSGLARTLRDSGGRGSERGRDDPQPPAGPRPRRPGIRDGAADARLQDDLERRLSAARRTAGIPPVPRRARAAAR